MGKAPSQAIASSYYHRNIESREIYVDSSSARFDRSYRFASADFAADTSGNVPAEAAVHFLAVCLRAPCINDLDLR